MIGIGGHLAMPPLPHHRAYGSVPRRFDWVKLGRRRGVGEDRVSRRRQPASSTGSARHRLGFVCDVAHATEDMVKQAVKIATKPLLLSHTALSRSRAMGPTPLQGRQITSDHARAIAETGGSIGIWHFFSSLDQYVD